MRRSPLGRTARPWAGAILALAALGWLAPTSGRAGCVHDLLGRSMGLAHFDGLASAGALATDDDHSPLDDANRPSPCPGGVCSPKRTPAPLAPASTPTGRAEQWGCLAERPAIPEPGAIFRPGDDDDSRPSRLGLSVFHPPRPA